MLQRLDATDFDNVYSLLESSFPTDEIRPYGLQKALFDNPAYRVLGLKDREKIQGLITVYDLNAVLFVEHFAVHPRCRNLGLGSRILQELFTCGEKPICLEVELPLTEQARRRIGFYRRNGFYYNDYPYVQPPLAPGQNPVDLRLMTSGKELTAGEFEAVKTLLYREVYQLPLLEP